LSKNLLVPPKKHKKALLGNVAYHIPLHFW
jgi:hypothetical protein